MDLKPLEARLPVVVLDQGDGRPTEGATKKLGLAHLHEEQEFGNELNAQAGRAR